jgi:hypothetical protein
VCVCVWCVCMSCSYPPLGAESLLPLRPCTPSHTLTHATYCLAPTHTSLPRTLSFAFPFLSRAPRHESALSPPLHTSSPPQHTHTHTLAHSTHTHTRTHTHTHTHSHALSLSLLLPPPPTRTPQHQSHSPLADRRTRTHTHYQSRLDPPPSARAAASSKGYTRTRRTRTLRLKSVACVPLVGGGEQPDKDGGRAQRGCLCPLLLHAAGE